MAAARPGADCLDVGDGLALFAPPRLPAAGTASDQAFDAYLRARTLFEERTGPSARQALELLQQAVGEDPNFAAAYSMMADLQAVLMDAAQRAARAAARGSGPLRQPGGGARPRSARRAAVGRVGAADAVAVDGGRDGVPPGPGARADVRPARIGGTAVCCCSSGTSTRASSSTAAASTSIRTTSGTVRRTATPCSMPAARRDAAAQLEALLAQKDLFSAHTLLGQVYAYLGRLEPAEGQAYLRKALAQSEIVRASEERARRHRRDANRGHDRGARLELSAVTRSGAAPFVARLEQGRARNV